MSHSPTRKDPPRAASLKEILELLWPIVRQRFKPKMWARTARRRHLVPAPLAESLQTRAHSPVGLHRAGPSPPPPCLRRGSLSAPASAGCGHGRARREYIAAAAPRLHHHPALRAKVSQASHRQLDAALISGVRSHPSVRRVLALDQILRLLLRRGPPKAEKATDTPQPKPLTLSIFR